MVPLGWSTLTDLHENLTPTAVVGALAVLLAAWLLLRPSSKPAAAATPLSPSTAFARQASGPPVNGDSGAPNLQGCFIPCEDGLIYGNADCGFPFENDLAEGIFLPMHRPTHDKALDKSGNYRYGDHFKGRKRLWEMRLQIRFKADVTEPMRFGIELEEYVPLNFATKRLMGVTVAALRSVAGSDLYHSVGDDPKKLQGSAELERPVFTMPMWAFDQYMVTPEGEEPPDLGDPHFSEFGTKRTDDLKGFIEAMGQLQLKTGPTYTFSFWGISQFLDDINWQVKKVFFKPIDFNMFCGKPPVHLVLYTLDAQGTEKRHVQSRKSYYFRVAFWSSLKPPSPDKLRRLTCKGGRDEPADVVATKQKGWGKKFGSMFTCCAQQRGGPNGIK